MAGIVDQILFSKQPKRFLKLEDLSRGISTAYCGNTMIRDSIFSLIRNYARKNDVSIEVMRYPFHDEELWAFTFLKQGTIFICINSGLSLCKQVFAAAHELYHIYCFVEETDQSSIRNGSLLKASTADEAGKTQEELEANAFASLLLMPTSAVQDQLYVCGIDSKHITLDDVLTMMDIFAMPYKACVLRLYECGIISAARAKELHELDGKDIQARILITGKAKRWQLDGTGTESFGTFLEDFTYNMEHEFLTESREKSERAYISSLIERYKLEVEGI